MSQANKKLTQEINTEQAEKALKSHAAFQRSIKK